MQERLYEQYDKARVLVSSHLACLGGDFIEDTCLSDILKNK